MIDRIDRDYLVELCKEREDLRDIHKHAMASYVQGRIDEYCSQNDISQADDPQLALHLNEYASRREKND